MKDETRLMFYLDDTEIYNFYFGDFDLTSRYSSPFRGDSNPSFSFKNVGTFSNPKVIFRDFGMDIVRYDGIGFVMHLFDICRTDAIDKIWKEMVIDPKAVVKKPRLKQPLNLPYVCTVEDITDFEMEYWEKLHFTKSFLKRFNVHSLKSMRRVGKKIWGTVEGNPTFAYLFKKKGAFKAYRPLDPRGDKFRGQNNGDILEGYDQLPRNGECLIVTSSLKDTMTLSMLGYNAVNPTSENSKRGLYKYMRELNSRFEKIYILFDNDLPGIKAAKSLSRDSGWGIINFPSWYSKDPSDLVMKSGNYLQLSMFFSQLNLTK